MVVVVPNELERKLAPEIVDAVDHVYASEPATEIVASALAHHRERCTALAVAIVASLEADSRFTVADLDKLLDTLPDGWSGEKSREIAEAHRNLLTMIASARTLLPQALAGQR